MVPDLDRVFRSIPEIKERLQINIELASPDDFIPVREGWRTGARSSPRKDIWSFVISTCMHKRCRRSSAGMRRTWATSGRCWLVAWSIGSGCWSISRRSSRDSTAIPRSIRRRSGEPWSGRPTRKAGSSDPSDPALSQSVNRARRAETVISSARRLATSKSEKSVLLDDGAVPLDQSRQSSSTVFGRERAPALRRATTSRRARLATCR